MERSDRRVSSQEAAFLKRLGYPDTEYSGAMSNSCFELSARYELMSGLSKADVRSDSGKRE